VAFARTSEEILPLVAAPSTFRVLLFPLHKKKSPCYKASVSTTPTLEEQIAVAGLTYGRRHDISYRTGLVLQVLGAAVLAVLYPLASPFYTTGIMLFEIGVLLSAIYLLVWMSWVKKIILGLVLIGLMLQVAGYFVAPEQYAGPVLIAGIGFVCAGTAGMVGKEAYCFGYREGWLLMMFGFPIMVLANLLGPRTGSSIPSASRSCSSCCSRSSGRSSNRSCCQHLPPMSVVCQLEDRAQRTFDRPQTSKKSRRSCRNFIPVSAPPIKNIFSAVIQGASRLFVTCCNLPLSYQDI